MPSLVRGGGTPASSKYNRESVERALDIHLGADWSAVRDGYDISTGRAIIHLRTVREAAIFVWACADKADRLAREQQKAEVT